MAARAPTTVWPAAARTGEGCCAAVDPGKASTVRVVLTLTACAPGAETDLFVETTDDGARGPWRALGAVPPTGATRPGVYSGAFSGLDAAVRLRYATGGTPATFAATLEFV